MTRPVFSPLFSTAATFPAGANPWSSQPPRVAPPGGLIIQGFTPQVDLPAEYMNYLIGLLGDWVNYLDSKGDSAFGSGADGTAVLDGVVTFPWATLSGSTYTMSRDVNLGNLTVNNGITLAQGNSSSAYRLYVTGTLTVLGTGLITMSGGTGAIGSVGTAGTGYGATGTVLGSGAGGAGTATGAGSNGISTTNSLGSAGGIAGHGPSTTSGSAGSVTAPAVGRGSSQTSFGQWMGHALGISAGASAPIAFTGGSGGGGGGGNNVALPGAGGGGGGGVLMISARSVVLAFAVSIMCAGGAGGDGTASACGGGGGGGGGYLRLVYSLLTVSTGTMSAAVNCPGGAGGASSAGGGTAGTAGSTGTLELINIV